MTGLIIGKNSCFRQAKIKTEGKKLGEMIFSGYKFGDCNYRPSVSKESNSRKFEMQALFTDRATRLRYYSNGQYRLTDSFRYTHLLAGMED